MRKYIWIGLGALLLIIQFIPSGRPGNIQENPGDLLASGAVPDSVAGLLKTSCYDCHSNQTVYPWYSKVAPASWLVVRDIKKGRESLNFSTWEESDRGKKAGMLSDIIDEVSAGDMPMRIYVVMHPETRLSEDDRKAITGWANQYGENLFR